MIKLPLPPSINQTYRSGYNRLTGKLVFFKTRKARGWLNEAIMEISRQWRRKKPLSGRLEVVIAMYFEDKRRDLDSGIKAILDALQKGGAIKNDRDIWDLYLSKNVDKKNPRVEIEINQEEE